MGVSNFWVLDLRRMGPLLHTCASPMASPAIFASSSGPSGWFRAAPVARVYTRRWRTGARGSTRHCFFFFFSPPVALAFLCILGLLSCIWGIVVWVLGVLFGGFHGFGGFFCMKGGLLCISGFIVSWGVLLYLGCLMGGFF